MAYINSNSIDVFPCANRGGNHNLQSRLTSEYNLTNIINQLIDQDSFVITTSLTSGGPLSFNIHGYYFNVLNYNDIINLGISGDDIYASIRIKANTSTGGVIFHELSVGGTEENEGSGLDDNDPTNGLFRGIIFTSPSDIPDAGGDQIYSLHILHRDSGVWSIPQESTVKFITDSSKRSIRIDDGELN